MGGGEKGKRRTAEREKFMYMLFLILHRVLDNKLPMRIIITHTDLK
jgi:hypothetical protein